jgi:type I restriction enzyme, S subunit
MTSKWNEHQFSELCDITRGASPRPIKSFISVEGMPWVKIADATGSNSRYIKSTNERIKLEGVSKSKKVFPGDLILSNSATPGLPKFMGIEACIHDGWMLLRNFRGLNKRFAYWMLLHERKNLVQQGNGSVFINLKTDILKNHIIKIPNEGEQEAIADCLDSLQSKIELTSQTNQTLEQIAQAIFKSWFVDFEPVKAKMAVLEAGGTAEQAELAAMSVISATDETALKQQQADQPEAYTELEQTAALFPSAMEDSQLGEIPEGWSTPLIQDVAKTIKGKSYKSTELEESTIALVTLKSFNRGGGYRLDGLKEYTGKYKPEQEVFAGDLIIAYTDVTQAADVIGKPAMVISDSKYDHLVISLDVAVIRPADDQLKYYLYGIAKTVHFQNHTKAHSTGTTVLHLSKTAVPEYKFTQASDELIKIYRKLTQPIFSDINENIEQNNTLSAYRDTLLPKLLSGDLPIASTEVA